MIYTDAMKRAFHSILPPKGFNVELLDSEHFLTIRLDEKKFASMLHSERLEAVQYVVKVKQALEDNGATVLVVRKSLGGKND
jgi:hypothetical protein